MGNYVLDELNAETITEALADVMMRTLEEPEYTWGRERSTFAQDEEERPDVKVAVGNCSLDFDLWKDLRNPAKVGLHPVGLDQLWEYYAHSTVDATDELGRTTMFRVPEPYSQAKQRFGRAVIVSVMLPVAHERAGEYATLMTGGVSAPPEGYQRSIGEVGNLLDTSVTRLVHRLIRDDRAVLAMNAHAVSAVTEKTVPTSRRGDAHGACKVVNYPQKSIGVLTGLGQFGAHRLVMRDELVGGSVRRFLGPLCSLVMFDAGEPRDGDGIRLLDEEWRDRVFRLHSGDSELAHLRFCGHFSGDGCTSCLQVCPADALAHSTPDPEGRWPDHIAGQAHRFWDGQLQFDYRNCTQPRSQMADVYGEWMCGRCLAACVAMGGRSVKAAGAFTRTVDSL